MIPWISNRGELSRYAGVFMVAVLGVCVFYWSYMRNTKIQAQQQATICPSLLSIGRSARDTLIIMRNEPLCTVYVLDNLK